MPENGKCTIKIDATAQVARITFSGATNIGALFPGFTKDQPISVPQGEIRYLTFYNGQASGPLSYTATFSGA